MLNSADYLSVGSGVFIFVGVEICLSP